MLLEALELLERREPRIGVVQVHDEADGHVALAEMVEERAAAGGVVERPAERVLHQSGLEFRFGDLPELLQPDAVLLRLAPFAQRVFRLHDLGDRAPRPLGQQHILAEQVQPRLVVGLVRAVLADAEHPGHHALQLAVGAVDGLGGGHARIDLDAQGLGLLAHPTAEAGQGADVVALIVHEPRHRQPGDVDRAALGQIEELVPGDGRLQRSALVLPVRDQLVQAARIDDGAREDVGADLGSLFQLGDGDLRPLRSRQLLQADRSGQAGGAPADDHHVVLHGLPGGRLLGRLSHGGMSPAALIARAVYL